MKKCNPRPSAAVFIPPWKALRPRSPEATDCKIRLGGAPAWRYQATMAWVISNTPQANPPQKMALNALLMDSFPPSRVRLQQLLRVLTRTLRQLGSAQHAGDFFRTLAGIKRTNQCPGAARDFPLLDQIMVVGKGRDLRQVGDAEHLVGPGQGFQFLAHGFRGAATDAGIDLVKHQGALRAARSFALLPGLHRRFE